jgi:hypothetical protein
MLLPKPLLPMLVLLLMVVLAIVHHPAQTGAQRGRR